MQGPVIAVRPLMQTICKDFKLIILTLINMLQLVDFFLSTLSMVLSFSSDETAVEPPPAATTSPQRPVLRIPKVPKTNTYIWNLLKATVPLLELEFLNTVVAN